MDNTVAAVDGLERNVVVVRLPETVLAVIVPQERQTVVADVNGGVVTEGRIDSQMEGDNTVTTLSGGQRVNIGSRSSKILIVKSIVLIVADGFITLKAWRKTGDGC